MRLHIACFLASLSLHACALGRLSTTAGDPNDPVTQAAEAVTERLFNEAQPAVNAAVSKLPPETQALVQAAYVALQQAIEVAEAKGVALLSEPAHADVIDALHGIAQVADVLHAVVHEPDARAAAQDGSTTLSMPLLVGP